MSSEWRHLVPAPRFMPLAAAAVGAVGGATYWIGAQIWPTSVAVVLAMLVTLLISSGASTRRRGAGFGLVFAVLIKYSALMALSAAKLPFALPANLALGFIMIAGHACSGALVFSVSKPASHTDLGIALAIGFAPAALIGIPGLIGLVAAIAARIAFIAFIRRKRPTIDVGDELDATQQLTEVSFYLGALATWAFV